MLIELDGAETEWPVPFWFVDAGAALMLLLLAAIDEGLAAGLTGVEGEAADKVRAAFGIPGDVTIVALVTMGAPAPDPGWSAVTTMLVSFSSLRSASAKESTNAFDAP